MIGTEMQGQRLALRGFSVAVDGGWDDITSTLGNPMGPLTLGNAESGVGALQFSPAVYESGEAPSIGVDELDAMLRDFAINRGLTGPFDRWTSSTGAMVVSESFHCGSAFVRVWYISDGKSVILITYVCDWEHRNEESELVDAVIKSVRFT
jgi:hypothetical protein